jgi:hypothetical protein
MPPKRGNEEFDTALQLTGPQKKKLKTKEARNIEFQEVQLSNAQFRANSKGPSPSASPKSQNYPTGLKGLPSSIDVEKFAEVGPKFRFLQ